MKLENFRKKREPIRVKRKNLLKNGEILRKKRKPFRVKRKISSMKP